MKKTILLISLLFFSAFLIQCGDESEFSSDQASSRELQNLVPVSGPREVSDRRAVMRGERNDERTEVATNNIPLPVPAPRRDLYKNNVSCNQGSSNIEYRFSNPAPSPYVCEVKVYVNGVYNDKYWRARHDANYCSEQVEESVSRVKAQGYSC